MKPGDAGKDARMEKVASTGEAQALRGRPESWERLFQQVGSGLAAIEQRGLNTRRQAMSTNMIILIVVLVLVFGGGGYFWSRRGSKG